MKQTSVPVPQAIYGLQLEKVTAMEQTADRRPEGEGSHRHLQAAFRCTGRKLKDLPTALAADKAAAEKKLADLKAANAPGAEIKRRREGRRRHAEGRRRGQGCVDQGQGRRRRERQALGGMPRHAHVLAGDPNGDPTAQKAFNESRRNFLALVFCLMVGTAALPHILMRYYTTPSVKEARESVTWSLFFIFLLYFTAPALAVLVKYEMFSMVVGAPFANLPEWIPAWNRVDPTLLSVTDVNADGILQLGELKIGGDIVVLATPAIGGLPYVVSGMVAAGGLAAALSTADGLLLTIANALSHDLYYKMIDPNASTARRVSISKALLLVVALAAAAVASQKPADILFLVSAAFSFAAASFFPALVLGIFWKRANKWGATLGMIAGLGTTFYYMATTQPWMRGVFGVTSPIADNIWWGIQPISAGLFGVPIGFP